MKEIFFIGGLVLVFTAIFLISRVLAIFLFGAYMIAVGYLIDKEKEL